MYVQEKNLYTANLRNSHITTRQRGKSECGETTIRRLAVICQATRSARLYRWRITVREKQRDRESESDNFARRCRRVKAAWRLVSAAIPWRIDRARHADWRHDHGLSQTVSTWTARRWSRGRRLIILFWLVDYDEPLHAIGLSEARRMITHTTSTVCRANRPEKASLHYQPFNGYVP